MEAGSTFGGAVTTSGTCFMFGSNAAGGLGCGDTKELRRTASEIKSVLLGHRVTAVACGETFSVAAAVAHADYAGTPTSASRARATTPKQHPLEGVHANKLFAWGRGMTDRCVLFCPSLLCTEIAHTDVVWFATVDVLIGRTWMHMYGTPVAYVGVVSLSLHALRTIRR